MKILIFAASLRCGSFNQRLAQLIAKSIAAPHEANLIDFKTISAPLYDGDAENSHGASEITLHFAKLLKEHHALIIVSPEYNFGTPGTLKNTLDWVSRLKPMPLANLPIMLAAASPALAGGHRGLLQTLVTLHSCDALAFPKMFTLAQADQVFADNGDLKDKTLAERLNKNINEFLVFAEKNSKPI